MLRVKLVQTNNFFKELQCLEFSGIPVAAFWPRRSPLSTGLIDHLKFTGFNDIAGIVPDLEDIYSPVEAIEHDGHFLLIQLQFKHLFAYEIINVQGVGIVCIKILLEFKVDKAHGRVGVKFHHFHFVIVNETGFDLSRCAEIKTDNKKKYVVNFLQ